MYDARVEKFARILVDYSTKVQPGDRVAITSSTEGIPAVQALYKLVLERGAYPHVLLEFPQQYDILIEAGSDEQLAYVPRFHKQAFEEFDVLLKVHARPNTRFTTQMAPERQEHLERSLAELIKVQMRRGATGELRWMSTIFPTNAYAMEADMGLREYMDFFFRACHADDGTPDPVAHWQQIHAEQQAIVDRIQGHDLVELRGPNVDLRLSVKDRIFLNSSGTHNMPDGEVYTGPVEDTAQGWVRFNYPCVYEGRVVEGVELKFKDGQVVEACAEKNEEFLLRMLNSDPGARFIGEFAIGTNYEIDRSTRSILFDEKIGGSFHMALGASYPETGGKNQSVIHWDMICGMQTDAEIAVDGEVIYRNGKFIF